MGWVYFLIFHLVGLIGLPAKHLQKGPVVLGMKLGRKGGSSVYKLRYTGVNISFSVIRWFHSNAVTHLCE